MALLIAQMVKMGLPEVLSGERADDGLYIPIIDRIRSGLHKSGLLFVGDCKMSALETRWHIANHQHVYLSPLPLTGPTAEAMESWIAPGIAKDEGGELERIFRTYDRGHVVLAAEGYEFERTCGAPQGDEEWTERVLVVLPVLEFVVRRSLQSDPAKLPGLHPESKQKRTDKPTVERLLKAFSDVSLTIIKDHTGEEIRRQLTPLSVLQQELLQRLGLSPSLYRQLEIQEIGN